MQRFYLFTTLTCTIYSVSLLKLTLTYDVKMPKIQCMGPFGHYKWDPNNNHIKTDKYVIPSPRIIRDSTIIQDTTFCVTKRPRANGTKLCCFYLLNSNISHFMWKVKLREKLIYKMLTNEIWLIMWWFNYWNLNGTADKKYIYFSILSLQNHHTCAGE